jgi:hypothetical protein
MGWVTVWAMSAVPIIPRTANRAPTRTAERLAAATASSSGCFETSSRTSPMRSGAPRSVDTTGVQISTCGAPSPSRRSLSTCPVWSPAASAGTS